jgi:hypothetical protein
VTARPESENHPETYYAGAYWGPRKESPEECARRTAVFLNLLASCDPFLAHWYKPAKSLKDARTYPLMPPDMPTLTELFRRGVNREKGGPVFETLGFSISISNGGDKYNRASLRISCGMYSEAVPNSCVLSLPTPGFAASADQVLTAALLTGVVRSLAMAYEPDWAVATSDSHRRLMSETSRVGAFVGWVTYLSRRRGTVPPLPAPVRIESVEDKGTLIVLTAERLTASNPEHVERGRHVGELLARAGLMQPIITP